MCAAILCTPSSTKQHFRRAAATHAELRALVRQLAGTTPHEGEWELCYRALQDRARRIMAIAAGNAAVPSSGKGRSCGNRQRSCGARARTRCQRSGSFHSRLTQQARLRPCLPCVVSRRSDCAAGGCCLPAARSISCSLAFTMLLKMHHRVDTASYRRPFPTADASLTSPAPERCTNASVGVVQVIGCIQFHRGHASCDSDHMAGRMAPGG